jgi:hypothetical protein
MTAEIYPISQWLRAQEGSATEGAEGIDRWANYLDEETMRFYRKRGGRRPTAPFFLIGERGRSEGTEYTFQNFRSGHLYTYESMDHQLWREARSMPLYLDAFLAERKSMDEEFNASEAEPDGVGPDTVDLAELAAAACRLFPNSDEEHVKLRSRLRPVSYEADAVDAVWTPEVHWRWQSPAFHAAVRALLMAHLRLSKAPMPESAAPNLGCVPHELLLLIVSQLGEVWVEPFPVVVRSNSQRTVCVDYE